MQMFYSLGKINQALLYKYFQNLMTDEIIVTRERIDHILQNHPQDVELFKKYGKISVQDPDMIVRDVSHEGTIFMIKKLPETNINVIVRLALQGENAKLKNSVMTFYRIRENNLKKLISKNKLLYSK